jgi:septal ring-binding cell division protein DamX
MMKRNVIMYAGALMLAVAAISCNTSPKQEGDTTTSTEKSTEKSASMETKELTVDLESSQVNWRGEMLGLYDHHGTIDISSASISVSGSEVVRVNS